MKRKLFMVAIAAVSMCVMVSCGKKDNKANDEKADTEEVAENEEEEDDADDTVEASVTKLLNDAYEDLNSTSSSPTHAQPITIKSSKKTVSSGAMSLPCGVLGRTMDFPSMTSMLS